MDLKKLGCFLATAVLVSAASPVASMEILVGNLNGENFVVEAEPEETLFSIQEKISAYLNASGLNRSGSVMSDIQQSSSNSVSAKEKSSEGPVKEFWLDYVLVRLQDQGAGAGRLQGLTADRNSALDPVEGRPRKYYAVLEESHKRAIGLIVRTLSEKSIASILRRRGELNDAGIVIQDVHPLKFLICVFTDDKLKVDIENIKQRGWIWKDFINGLKGSLQEESEHDNMKDEFVIDFAKEVGVDPAIILPSIHKQDWDHLVDLLIKYVPRKHNTKVFGA